MLHAVNDAKHVIARPWRLDDRGNCLWSLWVVGCLSLVPSFMTSQLPASVCTVSHLNFSSTVELFTCPLSRAVTLLRRWPSFTALHLAVDTSVYRSDTDWSEHGGWQHWLSHTRRPTIATGPSYLLSAISLSCKQPWNLKPCTLLPPWPLQRASVRKLFDVTMRRLEAVLYVSNSKIRNVRGHDRRCKTADAYEMQTQNSGIHTSLVTIRRGKTMRYDVSPNDKRWPPVSSHGPHVKALDSATWPHWRDEHTRGDQKVLILIAH